MALNKVHNYYNLQGIRYISDLQHRPRRDIDTRHVTIQNSSTKNKIRFAITTKCIEEDLDNLETNKIFPGEIIHIGINSPGDPQQYIHLLDAEENFSIGHSFPLRTDMSDFVLRDGENKWFVQGFVKSRNI